jgi:hypothetical protein
MRIIGGNDYYDSASAYGIDPGIVFVRKEFRLTNGDLDRIGRYRTKEFYIRPNDGEVASFNTEQKYRMGQIGKQKVSVLNPILIFCGKVYNGLFVTITEGSGVHEVKTEHRFWKADKFNAFLEEHNWIVGAFHLWHERGYTYLEEKFAVRDVTDDALQALIEKKIVIVQPKGQPPAAEYQYRGRAGWLEADSDWVANGDSLKDWDFQKAVDPVTAFQEISQWVGGTLSATNGPNTVEITDDKIKIAKHGMDHWSFRKQGKNSKI